MPDPELVCEFIEREPPQDGLDVLTLPVIALNITEASGVISVIVTELIPAETAPKFFQVAPPSELTCIEVGCDVPESVHDKATVVGEVGVAIRFVGAARVGSIVAAVVLMENVCVPLDAVAVMELKSLPVFGRQIYT